MNYQLHILGKTESTLTKPQPRNNKSCHAILYIAAAFHMVTEDIPQPNNTSTDKNTGC